MTVSETSDVKANRLSSADYVDNFSDIHPPLTPHEAHVEADRCYFCYDAPCMTACPTSIDIPMFIRKIRRQSGRRGEDHLRPEHFRRHVRPRLPDRNAVRGSLRARDGGRQAGEDRPAAALRDRHRRWREQPASSSTSAQRRPARRSRSSVRAPRALPARTGSQCLAMTSTVYEAREKAGGLNEYRHRLLQDDRATFAQAEVDFITSKSAASPSLRQGARPRRHARAADRRLRCGLPRSGAAGVNALGRRRQCGWKAASTRSTGSASCARHPNIFHSFPSAARGRHRRRHDRDRRRHAGQALGADEVTI
jgi:hypothetical protein